MIRRINTRLTISGTSIPVVSKSTVTTTFLDAYSAGVSSKTIWQKLPEKWIAVAVTILGTAAAIIFPMDNITGFLYFIGSVFAPMIAIQLADFFIVKTDSSQNKFDVTKLIIWFVGFIIYRLLMKTDFIVGNTLPDMIITFAITIITGKIKNKTADKSKL